REANFTPGYVPNMSPHIWSWDYSKVLPANAAVFVHEMVHVWQSGHGRHNILRGLYLWGKYDHITGDYEDSYKYDLDSSTLLSDFNMEQQAQIIEDYYRVSKGLPPEKKCRDAEKFERLRALCGATESSGEVPTTARPPHEDRAGLHWPQYVTSRLA